MSKKQTSIPVNYFGGDIDTGIVIEKIAFSDLPDISEWSGSERHDRHSFFLLEKGMVTMEIDFEKYKIKAPSFIYLHPNQVHRMLAFKGVTVICWAVNDENLHPEYLKLLEGINPAKPLLLKQDVFSLILETASLCTKFAERKKDKLHHSLLKDSCNALIGLAISQYMISSKTADSISRFEITTKAFKALLEQHFATIKRPSEFAQKLNISTPYLNECVKYTTGYPVSHHIQQRIVLEAKRLLYHSNKSIKEIAGELGYDDYPYFSRLFAKVAGITAVAFRNKNLD